MKIRSATIDDEAAVYELICALEATTFTRNCFNALYEHNLNDDRIHYLVAVRDDVIGGFLSLYTDDLLHHCGKVATIQELIIKEAYRHQQIGTALIAAAQKTAMDLNCISLEVTTNVKRTQAQLFYQHQGFTATHMTLTMELKK